jgi:hypothetical protein
MLYKKQSALLFIAILVVSIFATLFSVMFCASAQGGQADIHAYTKGEASSFPVYALSSASEPMKGGSVFDRNYGTTVTKAADAKEFPSEECNGIVRPVYSRWRIDNSKGDVYYLIKGGESPSGSGRGQMIFYYSSNDSIFKIASDIDGMEVAEFRWDYSGNKPYTLYYVSEMQFREYNVKTGETQLVKDFSIDFPEGERILNDVEGDSSADSRYWAWMVQGRYNGELFPMLAIIAYDKQTNTVLGKLDHSKYQSMGGTANDLPRPNMVDISPLGTKIVVLWGRTDKRDLFDGPHAYNFDFSNPIKVSNDETHGGWAFDQNGGEVYVSQINNSNWEKADADTIAYVNIKTGEVSVILYAEDAGWDAGGLHFSRFYNNNIRGWIYVTTYSEPSSQSWLRNTAAMIEIKPYTQHPRIWRIAQTHNNFNSEDPLHYEKEAFSPISADGLTIYWAADWPGGDGTVDTYKVQLPESWWTTLENSNILTIPETHSSTPAPATNSGTPTQTATNQITSTPSQASETPKTPVKESETSSLTYLILAVIISVIIVALVAVFLRRRTSSKLPPPPPPT